jgi:hypothetical protein
MLSTDNWCIKVASRVYGPYTTAQLESFAAEGRLVAHSQVAPAGGRVWRAANQYPNIAEFLKGADQKSKGKQFGKNVEKAKPTLEEGAVSNFVLIFDVVSGAASKLEHIIRNIGPAFRMTDNVWTVASDQTVMGIKNLITPHLQVRELVFVIDAHRGRSAWQNFAPETHSKLTKAWVGVKK